MQKIEHNAAQEVVLDEPIRAVKELKAITLSLNSLLGKWNNCDRQTRGLVGVTLSAQGNALKVQAFGACVPKPCDWGVVAGNAYADNVSGTNAIAFEAQFDAGFKTSILTGYLDNGTLVVENFTVFKDGSGRSSYYDRAYFYKA